MAARASASQGSKPDKIFRDALSLAVNRPHEDNPDNIKDFRKINALAAKLVDRAIEGNEAAVAIIRDSLDGKPAQQIILPGGGFNVSFILQNAPKIIEGHLSPLQITGAADDSD